MENPDRNMGSWANPSSHQECRRILQAERNQLPSCPAVRTHTDNNSRNKRTLARGNWRSEDNDDSTSGDRSWIAASNHASSYPFDGVAFGSSAIPMGDGIQDQLFVDALRIHAGLTGWRQGIV
ncbi:hypothetical protein VTN96DRAFT_9753 [Rasamsonia emersonii]